MQPRGGANWTSTKTRSLDRFTKSPRSAPASAVGEPFGTKPRSVSNGLPNMSVVTPASAAHASTLPPLQAPKSIDSGSDASETGRQQLPDATQQAASGAQIDDSQAPGSA